MCVPALLLRNWSWLAAVQSFNALGHGPWSLPSTFTTQPSVPAQPDPPVQVAESKVGAGLAHLASCARDSALCNRPHVTVLKQCLCNGVDVKCLVSVPF